MNQFLKRAIEDAKQVIKYGGRSPFDGGAVSSEDLIARNREKIKMLEDEIGREVILMHEARTLVADAKAFLNQHNEPHE